MIPLQPNKTYKIRYMDGNQHHNGDIVYFQTLDNVPEAKHLIQVRDVSTGQVVDLIELLAHPWDTLSEHNGAIPGRQSMDGANPLRAIIPFLIHAIKFWVRIAPVLRPSRV